ncbi:MAG: hypothetical protein MUQ32_08370, partial [Chloroflexi bacterium]|nr:hypothetical protein [Chloroflexota bacterium]
DSTKTGDAAIIGPDLPDGLYQLWWLCDNGGGPGSGIHYSPGPRLAIGVPPDTATETAAPQGPADPPVGLGGLMLVLGTAVFLVMLRPSATRRPKGGTS